MRSTRTALALSLVGALALAACGGDDEESSTAPLVSPTVNVGRTSDPVVDLLAEIYAQGMENAGVRVGRKDPSTDMDKLYAGLEGGTIQFVPDSTVAVLERYGTDEVPATPADQLTAINAALPAELSASAIGSATRTLVVVCSTEAVEADSLGSISDLATAVPDATIGGTAAFGTESTSFGLDDLNTAYDAEFQFADSGADDAEVAAAIDRGDVDCGVMSSLEPTIATLGLIPLEDDKAAAPVDSIVPVMQAIAATPEVVAVVTQLNSLLTTDVLRALLVKVEAGDQTVDVIAKAWIASQASDG